MKDIKGQQHYRNVGVFHRNEPVEEHKQRDLQKVEQCKELGIVFNCKEVNILKELH